MAREPNWDRVLAHLSQPTTVVDGKYAFTATTPDSFANPMRLGDTIIRSCWVARHAPRPRHRSTNNAANARLGVGSLELGRHLGLGLPAGCHVCGQGG